MTLDFLRDVELFHGLSESSLEAIAAALEEVSLPVDTYLFHEMSPADALFIVRSGSVRVIKQLPHVGMRVTTHLAPGAVLGEVGMSDAAGRATSVVTSAPSVLLKLDRSAFQQLAANDPLLRARIESLSERTRPVRDHELTPEGDVGIRMLGHRDYVGGLWEEIGRLQVDFLVAQGLEPAHCLLDIGCGALRGGVHFIRYLDRGNYLGLDKEKTLITLGVEQELGQWLHAWKQPEFVVSASFEFHRFSKRPHVSMAQSLFTHLSADDVGLCLRNLRAFVDRGHRLFATFFEGESVRNRPTSHSHAGFYYSRSEMERFGEQTGWTPVYVGDWRHPRQQMMIRYDAS